MERWVEAYPLDEAEDELADASERSIAASQVFANLPSSFAALI